MYSRRHWRLDESDAYAYYRCDSGYNHNALVYLTGGKWYAAGARGHYRSLRAALVAVDEAFPVKCRCTPGEVLAYEIELVEVEEMLKRTPRKAAKIRGRKSEHA